MGVLAGLQPYLDAVAQRPPMWEGSYVDARAAAEFGAPFLAGESVDVGSVRDRTIPGPAGALAVRVYQPHGYGPHGVLVYFHGGGFVMCSINTHDALCRRLCVLGNCVVVSVDYRLAPEHPFPAAIDDAIAATRWVQDNAAEINGDRARVAVGGDSAGATIASVVALANRDDPRPRLRLQMLLYAASDRRGGYPSLVENGDGYLLTLPLRQWFADAYVPADAAPDDWRLSPLCAPAHDGVAPALCVTAEFDPLRDEGNAYARRLADAGVPVEHRCAPGMIHGFATYAGVVPEVRAEVERIGTSLRRALA